MATKRHEKEKHILKAAEYVFAHNGFQNTKMTTIAERAEISKGTVYFYFKSKENLYMAITYEALSLLNDQLYEIVHQHRNEDGIEAVVAILDGYITFSQKHPLYTTVMLDYMALIRSSKDEKKVTKALKDSLFFHKLESIHNLPVSLVVKEIKRGQKDKSIRHTDQPEKMYLTAWAMIIGFLKLSDMAHSPRQSIHNVDIHEWRNSLKQTIRILLKHSV